MSKFTEKIGGGQRAFTFEFHSNDGAEETQDNGPCASPTPSEVRNRPERKRKWHSLFDTVFLPRTLQAAWERVRDNGGAAGGEGITIGQFARNADRWLDALHPDLRNKTYRPQPVRRVYIPKAGAVSMPWGSPPFGIA